MLDPLWCHTADWQGLRRTVWALRCEGDGRHSESSTCSCAAGAAPFAAGCNSLRVPGPVARPQQGRNTGRLIPSCLQQFDGAHQVARSTCRCRVHGLWMGVQCVTRCTKQSHLDIQVCRSICPYSESILLHRYQFVPLVLIWCRRLSMRHAWKDAPDPSNHELQQVCIVSVAPLAVCAPWLRSEHAPFTSLRRKSCGSSQSENAVC